MSKMNEGILVYDEIKKRMDIRFSLEEYYGGLNCGEGLEVLIKNTWYPTGIEIDTDWYFSNEKFRHNEAYHGKENLIGLPVRVKE